MTKNCPGCRYETYDEAIVCHNCGKKFRNIPDSYLTTQPPQLPLEQKKDELNTKPFTKIEIQCNKSARLTKSEQLIGWEQMLHGVGATKQTYKIPYSNLNLYPDIETQFYCPYCRQNLKLKLYFPPNKPKGLGLIYLVTLIPGILLLYFGVDTLLKYGILADQGLISLILLGLSFIFLGYFLLLITTKHFSTIENKDGKSDGHTMKVENFGVYQM